MTEELLRRAIGLAHEAKENGNPPFGSLLVGPNGDVLIEERNSSITDSDITAHPELKLARWAARELDAATAAGTTMYTSCQPCGMCEGAIARSGLGRVVFALSTEQLLGIKSGGDFPVVPKEGPALFEEAKAAVADYYS
ncbi:nucleoside deaminase [Allokutzneria sp. NRRL B-24872]|uniref:nucleoside deaminase n=1 Tax=Allokutzneria sp. NRRL B-24872 TaxID=1137961 RepID=UPI000A363F5F|nr:nucleoside deaminase [Allokutzneria sp. NRRL B-24872]